MRRALLVWLPVVMVLAACGSDTPAATSGASASSSGGAALAGTSWALSSYQGPGDNAAVPAVPDANAPLAFTTDGTVNGSTGCNQFSGSYTESGNALSIELGPMTQIACANPLVNAQESALVQLFGSVTGFDIEDGTLTLTGRANATLLTYAEGLTDLEGTSWRASGVNNGKGALSTTDLTPKLTAAFGADGAFTGSGVCNQVGGHYTTSGTNALTIAELESTEQDCGADGNALESQYLAALGKVTTYEIAGDKLTLRDDGGAAQATFTRAR